MIQYDPDVVEEEYENKIKVNKYKSKHCRVIFLRKIVNFNIKYII